MPETVKQRVLRELDAQIHAEDAVMRAWAKAPYSELLHDAAREANKLSLHFQCARRAVEMYG